MMYALNGVWPPVAPTAVVDAADAMDNFTLAIITGDLKEIRRLYIQDRERIFAARCPYGGGRGLAPIDYVIAKCVWWSVKVIRLLLQLGASPDGNTQDLD